jgi:seryl-tRNA synthetase
MLDIKWIRENPEKFDAAMQKRSNDTRALELVTMYNEKNKILTEQQATQGLRNSIAGQIAKAKKNGESFDSLMHEAKKINEKLENLDEKMYKILGDDLDKLSDKLLEIPNIPHDSVPVGSDENHNVEIEKFGEPRKFSFTPKAHDEIGEALRMLDFEQSALMSGARFSTLSGGLAQLERALSNFMLDVALENNYREVSPPNLVKSEAMRFSGQLPKFAEEAFSTSDGYWLIPTSEVSLVNLVAKKTLSESELPLRFTAYTPCFRREAGSAGKDTKGLIRQHQFKKVELVSITSAEASEAEHERMTNISCEILRRLELPFRKILLCSGDMGFCAQKTYDLEVWLPSQKKYREISSCSNCGDFQARRASIKYKTKEGKTHFVHTLNGSALAVGRTLLAILENYQNEDGSVNVPEVLTRYLGVKVISLKARID